MANKLYKDLKKEVAKQTGVSQKETSEILASFFDVVTMNLRKGERILTPIGVFDIKLVPERKWTIGERSGVTPPYYKAMLRQSEAVKRRLVRVRSR